MGDHGRVEDVEAAALTRVRGLGLRVNAAMSVHVAHGRTLVRQFDPLLFDADADTGWGDRLPAELDLPFGQDDHNPRAPALHAYLEGLPAWQKAVCQQVRDLVHAADPEVVETIKRTRQPYFVLDGNICALLATRDHVNVFLYDGGIVEDPDGIITGGHGNATARTVALYEDQPINSRALSAMVAQIIANNRAGGWRALTR